MAKEATPKAGHNSLSEEGKKLVERIENLTRDIEHEQKAAQELIKPLRRDIAHILKEEIKGTGVTAKTVRAVVKSRKKEREANEAREKLDIADRDTFDNIRLALGDLAELPLGEAALAAA